MNGLEIDADSKVNGNDLCNIMLSHGLITKATKSYICRFTPSLIINKGEVEEVADIVGKSIKQLELVNDTR